MSDDGFDFRRPAQRREPKQFEPPPWERDAFEEMERRKAEQAREQEEARLAEDARRQAEGEAAPQPREVPAVVPREVSEAEATAVRRDNEALERSAARIEESRLLEMMAGLAAEEPPATRSYWKVAIAVALILVAIGGVLMVWGIAALSGARKAGPVASFGGSAILLFGAGFVAAAVWLVVRTLRQRGVL